MEPFDIDKIIKDKLQEKNTWHEPAREAAKPFVWEAIQRNVHRKKSLTWHHLAAAVVLLLIGFFFVLSTVQQRHRREMNELAHQLDQMQREYSTQVKLLQSNGTLVESLEHELRQVEQQLVDLRADKPLAPQETIIYRTDTVFVKRVEYITTVTDAIRSNEETGTEALPEQPEIVEVPSRKTNDAIFLSASHLNNKRQSETLKFRFGSFAKKD